MCNFDTLDDATRQTLHDELMVYADAFGGKNFFLGFLEAIRQAKPHPLTAKNSQARFPQGTIRWNKVIFPDKITLLQKTRINESKQGNFLPDPEEKTYKTVLNLIRTLGPLQITLEPKGTETKLELRPFDRIDDTTTRLNPFFDAVFFCSVETVKKVLNYTKK